MPQTSSKLNINQLTIDLMQISDEIWAEFQFKRDPLENKISPEQKRQMIASSIACGIETAKKIRQKYGDASISEIYDAIGLTIIKSDEEHIGDRILFALYDPSRGVMLQERPIERLLEMQDEQILEKGDITSYILGHELFHHIESNDPETYTQKTKINLWKFLFYTHRSNVRALSEIAAMSFSKELHRLAYSPCLLEVVLVYPYDAQQAITMYQEVMSY